jgi:hypothetical protein
VLDIDAGKGRPCLDDRERCALVCRDVHSESGETPSQTASDPALVPPVRPFATLSGGSRVAGEDVSQRGFCE